MKRLMLVLAVVSSAGAEVGTVVHPEEKFDAVDAVVWSPLFQAGWDRMERETADGVRAPRGWGAGGDGDGSRALRTSATEAEVRAAEIFLRRSVLRVPLAGRSGVAVFRVLGRRRGGAGAVCGWCRWCRTLIRWVLP